MADVQDAFEWLNKELVLGGGDPISPQALPQGREPLLRLSMIKQSAPALSAKFSAEELNTTFVFYFKAKSKANMGPKEDDVLALYNLLNEALDPSKKFTQDDLQRYSQRYTEQFLRGKGFVAPENYGLSLYLTFRQPAKITIDKGDRAEEAKQKRSKTASVSNK